MIDGKTYNGTDLKEGDFYEMKIVKVEVEYSIKIGEERGFNNGYYVDEVIEYSDTTRVIN